MDASGSTNATTRTATNDAGEPGWVVARAAGPGFRTVITSGGHAVTADEPASVGGTNVGPTPYDLLLGSVSACMAMTLRMYAARKGWPLEEAVVAVRTRRAHAADCEQCAEDETPLPRLRLERRVELRGPLTEEQRARMLVIADRCPVKQALQHGVEVHAAP